jgi:hypothetical protein
MVMFALACTLTKLSMLFLVRRMLSSSSLFWRRVTLAAIGIVALQGTVFCFTVIFQCRSVATPFRPIIQYTLRRPAIDLSRPPQDYWAVTPGPQPNCINQGDSLLTAGIINTLTDFLVVLLPIRTIWTLQIPTRQHFFVMLLFGLGFISCGAGIARTYYLYQVTQTWDQTWASYPVWMSSAIELYVGVVSPLLPCKYISDKTTPDMRFGASSQTLFFNLPPPGLRLLNYP